MRKKQPPSAEATLFAKRITSNLPVELTDAQKSRDFLLQKVDGQTLLAYILSFGHEAQLDLTKLRPVDFVWQGPPTRTQDRVALAPISRLLFGPAANIERAYRFIEFLAPEYEKIRAIIEAFLPASERMTSTKGREQTIALKRFATAIAKAYIQWTKNRDTLSRHIPTH